MQNMADVSDATAIGIEPQGAAPPASKRPALRMRRANGIMTKDGVANLLRVLLQDYGILKGQLARRLGSSDIADDVLQEAYLRLRRMSDIHPIQHARSYLFRIALNIASDQRRSESRRLARSEIELLLRLEHDELDPQRIAEGRSSVRLLVRALEELPPRRRAILIAARLEKVPYPKIAQRFGVSTRFVEREIKQALDHCRDRLQINLSQGFGPLPPETSRR
jgi:RNA polymerase sigma factor (sigma-70 family)